MYLSSRDSYLTWDASVKAKNLQANSSLTLRTTLISDSFVRAEANALMPLLSYVPGSPGGSALLPNLITVKQWFLTPTSQGSGFKNSQDIFNVFPKLLSSIFDICSGVADKKGTSLNDLGATACSLGLQMVALSLIHTHSLSVYPSLLINVHLYVYVCVYV